MPKKQNLIGKKLQQFLYLFNTNDRYADYEADEFDTSCKRNSYMQKKSELPDLMSPSLSGSRRNSHVSSSKLTSPILNNSFNSPQVALSGDFDIQNEGVSETILAWRHIELWTNKHHEELGQTLNPGVTRKDISKAEQDLDIELPPSVVTSLRIHDGQDLSGSFKDNSGLFYTLELMSIDKIVEMTRNWRKVSDKVNSSIVQKKFNMDVMQNLRSPELTHETKFHNNKAEQHKETSSSVQYKSLETFNYEVNPDLEEDLKRTTLKYDVSDKAINLDAVKSNLNRQSSIPPNTVHDAYAHRDWIPILTDNAGNHVAIDLSPAANGKYGQVILFGREFDIKYVVAATWGDFLLNFAKDLESGNYIIRNDELIDDIMASDGDLYFFDRKLKKESNYFDVLKQRTITSYEQRKKEKAKLKFQKTISADFTTSSHTEDQSKNYSYEETELLDISESPAVDSSYIFGDLTYDSHIGESTQISTGKPQVGSSNPYLVNILHQDEDADSSRVSSSQQFSSEASSTTATSSSGNDQEKPSVKDVPDISKSSNSGITTETILPYETSNTEAKLSQQFENIAI